MSNSLKSLNLQTKRRPSTKFTLFRPPRRPLKINSTLSNQWSPSLNNLHSRDFLFQSVLLPAIWKQDDPLKMKLRKIKAKNTKAGKVAASPQAAAMGAVNGPNPAQVNRSVARNYGFITWMCSIPRPFPRAGPQHLFY